VANLEECIAAGMLRADRDAVAFRHEIARVAIEEELAPDRRMELHRRALPALAARAGQADLARLAHHAEAAGDVEAVLEYAPAAGERAAVLAAHREAAAQFARALRFADALPGEERTALLDRRSYECYLTNAMEEAIEARRQALDAYADRGDTLRAGDAHRWLSRLYWFKGDNLAAEEEAARAVELLETLPPGVELAWAYSNMAQLRMLASDYAGALDWGGQAIELAERLDQKEILAHALNNVGTAEFQVGLLEGPEKMERSLQLALEEGLEEHVARGYTNLGCSWIENRDYKRGDAYLEAGIAYCRDHDLESWRVYMTGWLSRSRLEQGRWDDAATDAGSILNLSSIAVPSRISALVVIGRLRIRRGDPDAWAPLDEARTLARATMELQRVVPVAAARAEAHLSEGHPELVAEETEEAVALALEHGRGWQLGEVCAWRHRAGIPAAEPELLAAAEPYRRELAGDPEQASKLWQELGCPYEAAIVLFESDDEELLRRSLAQLQELGARPAAARAARLLRERGARDLRMGPRASTRENVAGLTARELEVLKLLADGMRNAQIAERLVLSPKTVAHHVSAILRKLGTSTRTEAATEAGRLGLLEK
jgi:DNA-binding CsgD family transcriptional regulator/tetratricopeptide (TPR) repeat protein